MEVDESAASLLPIDSHHPPVVLPSTLAPLQIQLNKEVSAVLTSVRLTLLFFSQFLSNRLGQCSAMH